jgi:hypothetical protein
VFVDAVFRAEDDGSFPSDHVLMTEPVIGD